MDVVIVDDNERMRSILIAMLEANGACVRAFPCGPSALADIALRQPDIIFLDIQMPGMSGLEMLARIRDAYGARIPIVAVSSRAGDGDALLDDAGFDLVLAKPISPAALVAALHCQNRAAACPQTSGD